MGSIWGTLSGNIIGTLYFLYFQLIGFLLINSIFSQKDRITRVLVGSVSGMVLLQWTPALFAFFFGFSITAHVMAALFCGIPSVFLFLKKVPHKCIQLPSFQSIKSFASRHRIFLILCSFTFILFCMMLSSHTIPVAEDGIHTGQCTYGDMNLHLGIITSLVRQQTFPPFYSISPDAKLSYPFLCDSISSSIYIWGASLRYAYMLPMYLAFLQVMTGFYCIAYSWLKKVEKASLAWYLFFYNGGLGFVYFFDWAQERPYRFGDIFTEFYETPTNLINNNIRWVNIVVDMLLPQRATLFGYAVLFTCIWLLWRCVYQNEKELFPVAAMLTAALPMIHTHSFLAMALISAAWLLMDLCRQTGIQFAKKRPGLVLLVVFLSGMYLLQITNHQTGALDAPRFLYICLGVLSILFLFGLWCLLRYLKVNGLKPLLSTWGIYLVIILAISLPQLLYWTLGQTSNTGFLTGRFQWGNQGDDFLWFYMKNWGIILLLLIPAIIYCTRQGFEILSASFLIWFVVELICFSPNPYDNNKLLYVAFIFFCCISADYGYELYCKIKSMNGIKLWSTIFLFLSGISALLSMGRELVSDYTLYSDSHVKTAIYVDENTPTKATILTNERHNNEISSLTGRNIVSGAPNFLWTHGIYDQTRADDVRLMYEAPEVSLALYQKYGVDYVMISSWERSSYSINEMTFDSLFECVFTYNEIKLYKTNL